KVEKEEKEKQEATQEDVKVDESLAKDVKENGVDVVKDDKTLGKEMADLTFNFEIHRGGQFVWNPDLVYLGGGVFAESQTSHAKKRNSGPTASTTMSMRVTWNAVTTGTPRSSMRAVSAISAIPPGAVARIIVPAAIPNRTAMPPPNAAAIAIVASAQNATAPR
ncbi:hypothetical protein CMV_028028, partial [Castanea mollissima]